MLTIRSGACRKDLARLRAGLWGEKNLVFIRAKHASSLCRSALRCDVSDIQQGTTAEGVHLGAMAGTVDLIDRVSTGIEVTGHVLRLNPKLPEHIERLDMRVRYRGHTLDLRLTRDVLTLRGSHRGAAPINLGFKDNVYEFAGGSTRVFKLGS